MAKPKVSFGFKEIDHGFEKLTQELKALRERKSYVKIGVVGAKGEEQHGGLSNAELAAVHEFGAPSVNVPERSFIRSSFEAHKPEYMAKLRLGVKAFYEGRTPSLEPVLKLIGLKAEGDIRNRIRAGAGIPPPLQPETVARKGSDRPLVDTGQLVASISSAVVMDGGE